MHTNKVTIKKTDETDLENILKLWNSGEVMHYVGFPNGLGYTIEKLQRWLSGVNQTEHRCHYCIYEDEIGFCGETFYDIDFDHDIAALDIKLFPIAQGKGIAAYSLKYSINQVFEKNFATKVYVEPNPANKKAWSLYEKLGFVSKPRPEFLPADDVYLELTKDVWSLWDK